MNQTVEQLLQAALKLPDEEQLQLVSALTAAVEERGLRPFDDSWLEEIRRRSAEYDAGSIQAIPWAEVNERARGGPLEMATISFLPSGDAVSTRSAEKVCENVPAAER
ncbi:MAG TPA: addiction module protein [Gemmataceae bacterium]|nr:addiction module protein [Gemmataceae bacterium]